MLTPGSPQAVDWATALTLLDELQHLRRIITRLQHLADEIAQLIPRTPEPNER